MPTHRNRAGRRATAGEINRLLAPRPLPSDTLTSSILHPLQPDLLGEELVARVLRRQLDSGLPTDQLLPFALIGTSSEAQTQRMLTVFIRAAERHAWIADLLTSAADDASGRQHRGLLSRVPITTDLGVVEKVLPRQNTHLLRVAAQLTQRLLDRLGYSNGTGNPAATEADTAERARLLANLGARLSNLGRRDEALTVTTDAVDTYRRLAAANPAAFEPDLAMALNNLGIWLSDLGRRDEALTVTTDAVDTYRRLAATNPAAFEPDLARGLWGFAWVRAAGHGELPQALTAAQESVAGYERLARQAPQAFTRDLGGALATLADVLDALGRSDEAAHIRDRIDRLS